MEAQLRDLELIEMCIVQARRWLDEMDRLSKSFWGFLRWKKWNRLHLRYRYYIAVCNRILGRWLCELAMS